MGELKGLNIPWGHQTPNAKHEACPVGQEMGLRALLVLSSAWHFWQFGTAAAPACTCSHKAERMKQGWEAHHDPAHPELQWLLPPAWGI